jgi:hypothetical protein
MIEIPFEKSFASHEKAKYWSDKNELKPYVVKKSSHKKYWFDCDICNHTFDKIINNITHGGSWCSYCKGDKLCNNDTCGFCYNKSFASHEQSVFWSNLNNILPRNVNKCSNVKYWFLCNICNHNYQCSISNKLKNRSCSYCKGNKLCNDDNCDFCYNKSFASHERSVYWSDLNNILPRNVNKCSQVKYWFLCNICNHNFDILLSNITKGQWCSYCNSYKLCNLDNCDFCYNKSFASIKNTNYLFCNKNIISPRQICKRSNKTIKFKCYMCFHYFDKQLSNNSNCPYCNGHKLCDNNHCEFCYNKSFASHKQSIFWSNLNNILPRNVNKCSNVKYWFKCESCNFDFECALNHIVGRNTWCIKCSKSKKYSIISINWLNFIQSYNNIQIQHAENKCEYSIPNTQFKADGFCKETNTIYEFHGDYWHGNPNIYEPNNETYFGKKFGELYEKTLKREHQIKNMGFNLITIWESDWIKINKYIALLQRKYRKF